MASELEPIRLLDLAAQNAPLLPQVREAFEPLFSKSAFGLGPEVEDFEHDVATALGVAHAVGVSSGSDALLAALMALEVGPGDEVVTSPFTTFATVGAIARLGATPVFVDIEPATHHLDLALIPPAVTEHTRVILPVHLHGQPCDMSVLRELAGAFSIPVVEDATQAFGAAADQGRVGTLGALGCFSFRPASSFGAFGEAGLVTTDDGDLAWRVRMMRTHGAGRAHVHERLGGQFGMDGLQAAVLSVKLPHLPGWIEARREHAALYDLLFMESGLTPRFVRTPKRVAGHAYEQYVVRVPEQRDALAHVLAESAIETDAHAALAVHLQPCFEALGHGPGSFVHAERAAAESLALPMHAALRGEQIERVVETIAGFFGL